LLVILAAYERATRTPYANKCTDFSSRRGETIKLAANGSWTGLGGNETKTVSRTCVCVWGGGGVEQADSQIERKLTELAKAKENAVYDLQDMRLIRA
jgi:hypothetical protein